LVPDGGLSVVDGLDVNEVKDGLIVYDPASDRVHYLNATASVVFTLCDGTRHASDIAATVAAVFGAEAPGPDEVLACLAQFEQEGLLRSPA
jgi:hypothetical protein